MKRRGDFRDRLWGAPIGLALATGMGLIAGLVGDGAWDALSWIGLGLPALVCLWFGACRRR